MKVKLAKGWFAPDANLYSAGVHDDIPDEWDRDDILPSTALVVEEKQSRSAKKAPPPTKSKKKIDLSDI